MWKNIQKVFTKKQSKSPDPISNRVSRQAAGNESSPFSLNLQAADSSNDQEESKSPFAEAMRVAQEEQQKQGEEQIPETQYFDEPSAAEGQQPPNRLSLGSPIKSAKSFMRIMRGEYSNEQNRLSGGSPLDLQRSNSSPAHTSQSDSMYNQLTEDQRKVSQILGGGSKLDSLVLGLHGFKINDNPQDREVFVHCPQCELDVFDAGLTNDIKCKKCQFEFTPGQKAKRASETSSPLINNKPTGLLNRQSSDSGGGMPKSPVKTDISAFAIEQEPNLLKDDVVAEGEAVKPEVSVARQLFHKTVAEDEEEEKKDIVNLIPTSMLDDPEEGKSDGDDSDDYQRVGQSDSSETDSDEEEKHPDYRKQKRQRAKNNTKVPFTADNLMERPGKVLSSLFSQLTTNKQNSNSMQKPSAGAAAASRIDSSSAYVNELESVLLFVIEETVMDDFKDPVTKDINYKILLSALLMPFFQLRTRILEKHTYFEIGNIQFFVAGTAPHDFGKITTTSKVKLSSSVKKNESIQRINLVPLRRIEMSKNELLTQVLKPYFSNSIGSCLFKGQVLEIQDHEFFVKYCRPFFGAISNGTEVKMDSSMPKSVRIVRVAPIWSTQEQFNLANRKASETIKLIKTQILQQHFFGGLMCYLEKGETIMIAGQEFFINECQPRTGIVDESSIIEVEIGFTQETFQKKQVLADQRYAERLQQQMSSQQPASSSFPFNMVRTSSHMASTVQSDMEQLFQRDRDTEASGQDQSSSSRRRRRHSQNTTSRHGGGDGEQRSVMQAYAAHAEDFHRSHQHHHGSNRAPTHMNLLEILNHIQMGNQMQDGGDDLQVADYFQMMDKATPKSIVEALPVRVITEEQILVNTGEDEAMTKCMVCLVEYEKNEELRTMPCLHFFHRECIDKWLLERGSTCPICKFNIRKDYNVTSASQMSSNRQRHSEVHRSSRRFMGSEGNDFY